ncbi:MAG: hypothetical protein RLZZ70_746 [Candidatus Parcubacteria bacterium]|jgi:uncharacterized cofD-like protein
MRQNKYKIVVIGGGTGTYTLLRGLRQHADMLDITAIVTMADSGGSTGRLRDEFGSLPVGDVRMALSALAPADDRHGELLRDLFLYRFAKGEGLTGHNFGNLFLTALTDMLGSEVEAIAVASQVLRVAGRVLPVTTDNVHLVATYDSGRVVVGEHGIDEPEAEHHHDRIVDLATDRVAVVYPEAAAALLQADLIVFGPGDLYTSILANCVIGGMRDVLEASQARRVFVANLMARPGQTIGMHLSDYVSEIERYTGLLPHEVFVHGGSITADLVARYAALEGVHPVQVDLTHPAIRISEHDIVSGEIITPVQGDVLQRSFIRHDSDRLAAAVISLVTPQ